MSSKILNTSTVTEQLKSGVWPSKILYSERSNNALEYPALTVSGSTVLKQYILNLLPPLQNVVVFLGALQYFKYSKKNGIFICQEW